MLHTTKGVVFHYFKYAENSIIAKIYTQKFGMQSYILKGLGSKKARTQKAYLQPLSLVEISVYYKEGKGLQSLKAIKAETLFQSVPFNIHKSSIAFFLAEVLSKVIKEEESNNDLFEFIYHAIQYFDIDEENYNNFHLIFLLHLTKYLGIFPHGLNDENNSFFDLQDGTFKILKANHVHVCSKEESLVLRNILQSSFNAQNNLNISTLDRKNLLSSIIEYYSLHLCNLRSLKSRDILIEVLS